jgi:eukaryotic-like serine/threonine-protein kinase
MGSPLLPSDPKRVGPYRLLSRLGSGGMGVVYLAQARGQRVTVAVKVLKEEFAGNAELRNRFAYEARALVRVSSTGAVRVLAADATGPVPYIAMERVNGPSLTEWVSSRGPFAGAPLDALGVCLLKGLAAIHSAGIVHRDLKPDNVLLTADSGSPSWRMEPG